jgi:hypothetical protein
MRDRCFPALRTVVSRAFVAMAASGGRTFRVDPFCIRQFEDDSYFGTRLAPVTTTEFEDTVNKLWDDGKARSLHGTAKSVAHTYMGTR